MQVIHFSHANDLVQEVARRLSAKLQEDGLIGFATGRTMDPIYLALQELAPFEIKAQASMLDEYVGLVASDSRSYRYYLQTRVFAPLGLPKNKIHLPKLEEMPVNKAAQAYENQLMSLGGLRVQLLGLGLNGHVGLNEPGSTIDSRTRIVEIAEKTRISNQSFFNSLEDVPKEALTLGLGTLNEAQELWLIVTGLSKAKILKEVLEGPRTTDVPASLLRDHKGLKIFVDKEAASLLKKPVS